MQGHGRSLGVNREKKRSKTSQWGTPPIRKQRIEQKSAEETEVNKWREEN